MFSNYLSSIKGVSIFPIISLIIFFGLFVGMIVWVIRLDRNYLKTMGHLPLESNEQQNKNSEIENEIKI